MPSVGAAKAVARGGLLQRGDFNADHLADRVHAWLVQLSPMVARVYLFAALAGGGGDPSRVRGSVPAFR